MLMMNTDNQPDNAVPQKVRICKHVRSNKSFYADGPASAGEYDCGIVWCALTNDGMGPDYAVSDVEECISGRECYER